MNKGDIELTSFVEDRNDASPKQPLALPDEEVSEPLDKRTLLAVLFLGLSVTGPVTCGQLMVGAILSQVAADLSNNTASSGWVVSGWALASSVTFAVSGRTSDIFGRRYVILLGDALGIIGAIVGATAQSLGALIAGTVLMGLATGLVLVSFAAIPELLPHKYRGLGLAWNETCLFVPFGAFAALLSNLLLEHASWRWIFYIAIIYSSLSLLGTAVFYFPPSAGAALGSLSRWEALLKMDYIGITLFAGSLVSCSIGLIWAGTPEHPWRSAGTIAPIVIGGVGLVATFIYEFTFVESDRALFPKRLFWRWREFTVVLVCSFVTGAVYYTNAGLLPQATLEIFSPDPITAGIILIPNGVGQWFGSTVIPGLLHIFKSSKVPIVAAVFLQTLFVGLYAFAIPSHRGAWMAFQFFGQGCFDWITTCAIVNISLHIPHSDLGVAVGVLGTFRSFGGTIGNAIFRAVLSSSLSSNLGEFIAREAALYHYPSHFIPQFVAAIQSYTGGAKDAFSSIPPVSSELLTAALEAMRGAYATAFKLVFYTMIPFGVVSFVCSLFIKDTRRLMTAKISVRMERRGSTTAQ